MKLNFLTILFWVLFLSALFWFLHGCFDRPPKNHAKREYPSAEAMTMWTDFSGDYAVERIQYGRYRMNHRSFIDETEMRTNNAHITIRQSGPTNMTLVYDRYGDALTTNALFFGKSVTNRWTWVWDNGKALYEEKYQGHGTVIPGIVMPGIVSVNANQTCIVSKNDDSSLTITSTIKSDGRFLWIIPKSNPEDCSILKLVPVVPEQTNSVNRQSEINENNENNRP